MAETAWPTLTLATSVAVSVAETFQALVSTTTICAVEDEDEVDPEPLDPPSAAAPPDDEPSEEDVDPAVCPTVRSLISATTPSIGEVSVASSRSCSAEVTFAWLEATSALAAAISVLVPLSRVSS